MSVVYAFTEVNQDKITTTTQNWQKFTITLLQFLLAEVCLQPFYGNFIIDSSNEKPCRMNNPVFDALSRNTVSGIHLKYIVFASFLDVLWGEET